MYVHGGRSNRGARSCGIALYHELGRAPTTTTTTTSLRLVHWQGMRVATPSALSWLASRGRTHQSSSQPSRRSPCFCNFNSSNCVYMHFENVSMRVGECVSKPLSNDLHPRLLLYGHRRLSHIWIHRSPHTYYVESPMCMYILVYMQLHTHREVLLDILVRTRTYSEQASRRRRGFALSMPQLQRACTPGCVVLLHYRIAYMCSTISLHQDSSIYYEYSCDPKEKGVYPADNYGNERTIDS